MTMKENQNAASFDFESLGSKDILELNDSRMGPGPTTFDAKEKNESSSFKVMDEISIQNDNGTLDSPRKKGQNGESCHLSGWDKEADSFSSDSSDIDKEQRSPDHESSAAVAEFVDYNENGSRDSRSPFNRDQELHETETRMFTDKNVLECDSPELEVCYKDINRQILKDIGIDEWKPSRDINVIESCDIEKSSLLIPGVIFPAAGDSLLEGNKDLSVIQCRNNEGNVVNVLDFEGKIESSLDNSSEKASADDSDPENSVQIAEATGKAENDTSQVDSSVAQDLPTEDFRGGTGKAIPESSYASIEVGGEGEDVKGSIAEGRTIASSFNSLVHEVVGNSITKSVEKYSAESADVSEDVNTETLSNVTIVENVQEQPINIKDVNSDGDSATSSVQYVRSENGGSENAHEQSPENEDERSSNTAQSVELKIPQHERNYSSVVNQLQHDEGETSFSAASLITYSGPIAFSGSLSHRSDGSTTSGKSFAFPILQSEWNSSPVRMAKADRRHFRKHKSWRSGLLCCRF